MRTEEWRASDTGEVSVRDYQFDLHTCSHTHTHSHTVSDLTRLAIQSAGSQRACMNLQEFLLSSSQPLLLGDYRHLHTVKELLWWNPSVLSARFTCCLQERVEYGATLSPPWLILHMPDQKWEMLEKLQKKRLEASDKTEIDKCQASAESRRKQRSFTWTRAKPLSLREMRNREDCADTF